MKNKNLKGILNVGGQLLLGAVKGLNPVVGGAVEGVKGIAKGVAAEVAKNKAANDPVAGEGKINYAQLVPQYAVTILALVLIVLALTGKITLEQAEDALKLFTKFAE
jgi:hypothetical protein